MNVSARSVVVLLIAIATACGAGRVLSAQRLYEPTMHRSDLEGDRRSLWPKATPRPMPTFSSNDRARWATVRSLVDHGTYVVGTRQIRAEEPGYKDTGILFEDGWQTIDRVLHPDTLEFYSSKPPLLSTLVAGLYWLLHAAFGWSLANDPFAVVRTILLFINILPFAIYLLVLDRWVARFARTDWTRITVMAAAAFGTTMTPFLITFNNHTLGTVSVLFALDGVLSLWMGTAKRPWLAFVQAGFFASFAATNELPALAFTAAVLGLLCLCSVARTLAFAAPPMLLVAFAFFGTNYLAVGQWRPAYSEFGSIWYEYPGSHWKKPAAGEIKYGIDWARMHESRAEYALHVLVGHHGLFSLTPIWLLAIAGAVVVCVRSRRANDLAEPNSEQAWNIPWFLGPLTLALTAVVIAFYLFKSDNYGGFSNGLRWLMWLSPLWLLTMIPTVDWFAKCPRGRAFVLVLLAVSVMSAHYSLWNPWRHPWIFDVMRAYGWSGYGI
ncbi:MAG: hypothetical protein WCL32_17105 [Planctomycetota bacterium]